MSDVIRKTWKQDHWNVVYGNNFLGRIIKTYIFDM